jgi:SAM-dependent methyltransferase
MSERFSGDWLALREGFDAAARSPALAARLAEALPARPRILDLGAGTGSLFRWLAPRIGRAQAWTLADADPALLARALDDIAHWAAAHGYGVIDTGRSLELYTPVGIWRVGVRVVDLARTLPLAGQDAVVCSALLDLVSAAWIDILAARLRVPLLACLSVDGRDAVLPRHPADALVRAGFRRDQGRDKGLGPALGQRAPAVLHAALAAQGFAIASAPSDWRIPRTAAAMLAELVHGHADAAALRMPGHRRAIAAWRQARLARIARGQLAIRIGHRDSLALPPAR